jgi:hypothetical protein
MGKKDKAGGRFELSRRDFMKVAGASAVAVAAVEPLMPAPAAAITMDTGHTKKEYLSTCPYCSAQCGQVVTVGEPTSGATPAAKVYDIWGDKNAPTNRGGLCSKGAGAFQLVTNQRRLGVPDHIGLVDGFDFSNKAITSVTTAGAWKRIGNGGWAPMTLDAAMGEIAPRLVAARGPVGAVGETRNLFAAGEMIGTTTYTGFSGYQAIQRADGKWFVTINGNKVAPAVLAAMLVAPMPAGYAALLASFDELVFVADDPSQRSTYTLAGTSDLGAKLWAATVMANTGHTVRDGAIYYAYVCDVSGKMHVATSTDMLVWTYVPLTGALNSPAGVSGLKSPSVIKNGADLKVWSTAFSAPGVEDDTLWYSEYTAGAWNTAVPVMIGGVATAPFTGHPYVEASATAYTMHYVVGGEGIKKATALIAAPTVFAAGTVVYESAPDSEGNVSAGPGWVGYTTYNFAGQPSIPPVGRLGWAYSDIKAVLTAAVNNAKSVQFFGSSHINNEANYTYRKLIAQFGTSCVEHQARI